MKDKLVNGLLKFNVVIDKGGWKCGVFWELKREWILF